MNETANIVSTELLNKLNQNVTVAQALQIFKSTLKLDYRGLPTLAQNVV